MQCKGPQNTVGAMMINISLLLSPLEVLCGSDLHKHRCPLDNPSVMLIRDCPFNVYDVNGRVNHV